MVLVRPLLRGEIIGDSLHRFVHDPRIIASVFDPAFCNKRRQRRRITKFICPSIPRNRKNNSRKTRVSHHFFLFEKGLPEEEQGEIFKSQARNRNFPLFSRCSFLPSFLPVEGSINRRERNSPAITDNRSSWREI